MGSTGTLENTPLPTHQAHPPSQIITRRMTAVGKSALVPPTGSGFNPPLKHTTSTRPYTLNIDRAIQGKIKATKREQLSCQMTGGGLVMYLSTAYFEGFRSALTQYLLVSDELAFRVSESFDKSGLKVQSTYSIELQNKKAYVVNLYHTKSTILINGAIS